MRGGSKKKKTNRSVSNRVPRSRRARAAQGGSAGEAQRWRRKRRKTGRGGSRRLTVVRNIPPRETAARGRRQSLVRAYRLPRGDTCRMRCLIEVPAHTRKGQEGRGGKAA